MCAEKVGAGDGKYADVILDSSKTAGRANDEASQPPSKNKDIAVNSKLVESQI